MAAQSSRSAEPIRPAEPARLGGVPMPHVLSDGVVTLTTLAPDDFALLFTWLNDADAARLDVPYLPVNCLAYHDWLEKIARDASQLLFCVRRNAAPRRPVGFVLFKNFQSVYRSAELGARIGADADRGQGYGARAVRLALAYAWETLNLHRISLQVFAGNDRAHACYAKAGFREEGLLREAAYIGGRWLDVMVMAALRPPQPDARGRDF